MTCFLCAQTSVFWIANLLRMFRWSASKRRRGRWRRADKKPFSFRRCWESRWWDLFPCFHPIKSHQVLNAFLYQIDIDWLFVWICVLQKLFFTPMMWPFYYGKKRFSARWAVLEKLLGTSRELQTIWQRMGRMTYGNDKKNIKDGSLKKWSNGPFSMDKKPWLLIINGIILIYQ